MAYMRDANGQQQRFIYNGFIRDSSDIQYSGWGVQLEQFGATDSDEPVMDLPSARILDNNAEIPSLENVPQPTRGNSFWQHIGGEAVLHTPNVHVFDPAGVPVDFGNLYRHNNEGDFSAASDPGPQQDVVDIDRMFTYGGAASHGMRSVDMTEQSEDFDDSSSILSANNIAPSTIDTSEFTNQTEEASSTLNTNVCSECGKVCNRPSDLKKHKRTHTPEELRPFGCAQCGRRFLFQKDLDRHAYTHLESRSQCEDCQQFYKRPDHLIRHRQTCPRGRGSGRARANTSSRKRTTLSPHLERPRAASTPSQLRPMELFPSPTSPVRDTPQMRMRGVMMTTHVYPSVGEDARLPLNGLAMPLNDETMGGALDNGVQHTVPFANPYFSPFELDPSQDVGITNQGLPLTPPQSAHGSSAYPNSFDNRVVFRYPPEFPITPSRPPRRRD